MRRRAAWVPVANKVIGTWAPRRRDAEPLAALAEHARSLEKSDHHLDQGFTDDMTVLWQAFTTAEDLSPIGRLALRQDVVRRLAIRLRVAAQPGRLAQRPLRPVFVIGLPRSGTTLLHRLLADAPGLRAPMLFELLDPRPAGTGQSLRAMRAGLTVASSRALAPATRAMHPLHARQPEECSFLLPHGLFHHARIRVPGYLAWLAERADNAAAEDYRYLGRQLRFIDNQDAPSRWVLKCPAHLWSLRALLAAFPDATLVWVHRDPLVALPSWCSLTEATMGMHTDPDLVDLTVLGRDWLQIWAQALTRAMRVREHADPARFIDVPYAELTHAPASAIARGGGPRGGRPPPPPGARPRAAPAPPPPHGAPPRAARAPADR
ncbi:sulfotransferase family protein, partial [Nonomuraea sp. NPDC059022]|uniref:sulfotransferase family protein n=1 Tax=Nonomuraea sp. NPDC059022 TaxID=3346705 RepID=UPI0036ABE4ED